MDTEQAPARQAPDSAPESPGGAARGPGGSGDGAGTWDASAGLLRAMGLPPDGGAAKLDGITAPPAGKPSGRATPEIAKQRQDKQSLRDKLGATKPAAAATPASQEAPPPPAAAPPAAPPPRPLDDSAGSVEAMIATLETSDDPAARLQAAKALAASRSPKAKPALERALRDRDQAVAAAAMAALQQIV